MNRNALDQSIAKLERQAAAQKPPPEVARVFKRIRPQMERALPQLVSIVSPVKRSLANVKTSGGSGINVSKRSMGIGYGMEGVLFEQTPADAKGETAVEIRGSVDAFLSYNTTRKNPWTVNCWFSVWGDNRIGMSQAIAEAIGGSPGRAKYTTHPPAFEFSGRGASSATSRGALSKLKKAIVQGIKVLAKFKTDAENQVPVAVQKLVEQQAEAERQEAARREKAEAEEAARREKAEAEEPLRAIARAYKKDLQEAAGDVPWHMDYLKYRYVGVNLYQGGKATFSGVHSRIPGYFTHYEYEYDELGDTLEPTEDIEFWEEWDHKSGEVMAKYESKYPEYGFTTSAGASHYDFTV